MAEVKDKVITAESLLALHDYNANTYETKEDVENLLEERLGNVDNTSDADKPISIAVQTALDGKANASHGNHVPATQTADNKIFLRNDNTWQTITPANIGASATSHTHDDRYYTETEVNTKLESYLPLSGGTITGNLTANGNVTIKGSSGIYLTTNDSCIYGRTTGGKDYEAFNPCSEADNVGIGHGLWSAGIGSTNIYGNMIKLNAKEGIEFTGYVTSQVNMGTTKASDSSGYYWNGNGTGRFNALRYTSIAAISSARRYKENIDYKDTEYWHDGLMGVKPCTYNYINGDDKSQKIGVIAEDLAEYLPDLVEFNDKGECETVYYMDFIMPLVAEVQRLNKKLDEQQEEIQQLKELVAKLVP